MASERATSVETTRRKPSSRERENNRMREKRRRAITTKIFTGLRAQGNYNLPKHSDNNDVLKALCEEAGWFVEEDGTIYRKDWKPPLNNDAGTSHFSYSQNPSPTIPSYQITPQSFPSLRISNSAPVTPPLYSPTSRITKPISTWDSIAKESMAFFNYPFVAASTPVSPKHQQLNTPTPTSKFQAFAQSPFEVPSSSSSFNVVDYVVQPSVAENSMSKMKSVKMFGVHVNPWIGEKIHGEGFDDLELTLGIGKGRT